MPHLPLWSILCALALAAAAFGCCVGVSQGCLRIGRGISDTGSATGYQDAVSPPILARSIFALNITFLAIAGYSLWQFGFLVTLGEAVGAFVLVGIGTYLAPKPTAPYYARLTYMSLSKRAANYAKHNDFVRARVAQDLAEEIAKRFSDEVGTSLARYMGIRQ